MENPAVISTPQQQLDLKDSAPLKLVIDSDGHGVCSKDHFSTPGIAGSPGSQKSTSSISPSSRQTAAEQFQNTSADRGRGQAPPLNTPSMFVGKQRSPRRKAPF
jgi:hypothetical protein